MLSVNSETKPLLAGTQEQQSDDVIQLKQRCRRVHMAIMLLQVVLWVTLGATHELYTDVEHESNYVPRTTFVDVTVCIGLFYVYVIYAVKVGTTKLYEVGQYGAALVLVILTAKLWLYGGWATRVPVTVCIVVACVSVVAHFVAFKIAHGTEVVQQTTLKWEACKQILRPYFIPRGTRNKIFVVLTWIVLIGGKVCAIFSPIVLGQIVSNLTMTPPKNCNVLIAIYCSLNLAPSVLREVQDNLYVKVWQVAYAEVAETTFRHVHKLSLEWHLKKKMGNIVRAMDRGMNGADVLMYYTMIYLFPAFASAIAAFVVFAVHFEQPEVAAICFLAFGFYCWVTFVVTIWRRKFREDMNKHDNEMHDKASDSLINFETVKCFTNEEHEVQHYISSVKAYQMGSFNTQASTSVLNISQSTTIQLSMLGSMLVAAYCSIHAEDGFDAGEFVAIQSYVMTIFQPLSSLGMIYNMIINSMVDIQNLSDLLSANPDIVDRDDSVDVHALYMERQMKKQKQLQTMSIPPSLSLAASNASSSVASNGVSIEFRDVYFKYPTAGPQQGLKGISFVVPPGSSCAIVGPTGSGKTTISRLLFRFYDVNEGAVLIDGHDVRDCTQRSVRQLIGVVPQDTVMFNESVRYNIRYGRLTATDAEVEAAAKKAQVHDFVLKFEHGYDTVCGERGLKLSGGEKQRIAIARCLLKDPPIVLLDEATSALDNKTEREVQAAMACLEGRTTLMIAHRLSTVQRCDQILVIKDGVLAERGHHLQLLSLNGIYASMWNMQLFDNASDYVI